MSTDYKTKYFAEKLTSSNLLILFTETQDSTKPLITQGRAFRGVINILKRARLVKTYTNIIKVKLIIINIFI